MTLFVDFDINKLCIHDPGLAPNVYISLQIYTKLHVWYLITSTTLCNVLCASTHHVLLSSSKLQNEESTNAITNTNQYLFNATTKQYMCH